MMGRHLSPDPRADLAPLTAEDLPELPSWAAEISPRPDRWRDEDTRSLAVRLPGRTSPVALGQVWVSTLHPGHHWVEVVVDPDLRRQGWGRWLVCELAALRRTLTPLRCRGFMDSPRWLFARALGASTVQLVPPVQIRTDNRARLHPDDRVIPAAACSPAALEAAWVAMYAWTHQGWADLAADAGPALADGLVADLDLEASSVVVGDDGQICALAYVFDDQPPTICAETTGSDVPRGEHLVGACLRRSLDQLAGRGLDLVEFDGHVTDRHLLPNWTGLSPQGPWFTIMHLDEELTAPH